METKVMSTELLALGKRLAQLLARIIDKQQQELAVIIDLGTRQERSKDQQPVPIIRSEIGIPPELVARYEAAQANDHEHQMRSHRLHLWTFWVNVFTLITLAVYTTLVNKQWLAMLESNRVTRISADAAKSAAETAKRHLTLPSSHLSKRNELTCGRVFSICQAHLYVKIKREYTFAQMFISSIVEEPRQTEFTFTVMPHLGQLPNRP